MSSCIALVVAAGRGTRLGGAVPKQYRLLAAKSVLRYSLEMLTADADIDAVRVVFNPHDQVLYDAAVGGLDLMTPVAGGETRQDSARLGLESLAASPPDCVLIHDAARPFLDPGIVAAVVGALKQAPAAIPALSLRDTIKRAHGHIVSATLDRAELWRAQTPQGFHYADILAAHRTAPWGHDLLDDAAVAGTRRTCGKTGAGQRGEFQSDNRGRSARCRAALGVGSRRCPDRPGLRRARFRARRSPHAVRREGATRSWLDRTFRRRCRAPCIDRRASRRDWRRRYRHAFPAQRSALARCVLGPISAPRRGAGEGEGRHDRACRCHRHLRAAEGRAASRSDGGADRVDPRPRSGPRQRQGDDDRKARLYRTWRGPRRPSHRHREDCRCERYPHPRRNRARSVPSPRLEIGDGGILHRRHGRGGAHRHRRLFGCRRAASSPIPTRPRPISSACPRR